MEKPADSSHALVDVQIDNGIGWLILNRPYKLNAMNAALLDEFSAALSEMSDNDVVRVIVIRGAGRCFSTGYDLERSSEEAEGGHRTAVSDFARLKRSW